MDKDTKKMGKIVCAFAAIFLAVLLMQFASASGLNFLSYNPNSVERTALPEIPSPEIISYSAYPQKVMPGQVLLVTAEVEDVYGIKEAKAFFGNENEPVEMNMLLISGTGKKGIYEARWIVKDTLAQVWYNTTIRFTNIFGKISEANVEWQDPTVTHKADEITGGTFSGTYNFSQSVNLMDDYTKLLLHFDGSDAANASGAIDSATGKTVAGSYGSAQLDTAQKKFGTASLLLNGSTDYITFADSADWNFGTGDFTIDFWFRQSDYAAGTYVPFYSQYVDTSNYISCYGTSASASEQSLRFYVQSGGVAEAYYLSATTTLWSLNTWNHLAFVRDGASFKIYLNGASVALTESGAIGTNSLPDLASTARIGWDDSLNDVYFNGSLDEFRISKGVARWTSGFSAPTSEYGTAKFGDIQYYGEDRTTRFKVGSFTKNTNDADQSTTVITGVGFKPKAVDFYWVGADGAGSGTDDGTVRASYVTYGTTPLYYHGDGSIVIVKSDSGALWNGQVSTWGSDGFTITWSLTGSGWVTNSVVHWKAYR